MILSIMGKLLKYNIKTNEPDDRNSDALRLATMHRIKGLSEHFVYFNDDMFITNYVKEEDFFKYYSSADNADLIKAKFTFPEQADFEHSHVVMNKNNSKFPRYVVNVDKQEYIQLDHTEGEDDLFPVAILTAVGNGRGGGDYFGPHAEYAGAWAGDLLMGATSLVGAFILIYLHEGNPRRPPYVQGPV